jgi:thioredoxin 1
VKKNHGTVLCFAVLLLSSLFFSESSEILSADPDKPPAVPVKGMVTMVDFGANSCIPCKMMAPILEKLEKEYKGKAAIVVIDVWKDPSQSKKFGVEAIPTQIFYDKKGKEVYRHVGFMSESAIVGQLKSMGIQ